MAQNALTQQDSKWLNKFFIKVFCATTAQLHVYGADLTVNQSPGPTQLVPDQLYKAAITYAVAAVKDSLCGASTVLLASQSGQGNTPCSEYLLVTLIHLTSQVQISIRDSTISKGD